MSKTQSAEPTPDEERIRGWEEQFRGYRAPVTAQRIRNWLEQFGCHIEIGSKLLDAVEFYGAEDIEAAFRSSINGIDGWNSDESQRTGRWVFAPLQGDAGKSGGVMLSHIRNSLRMTPRRYQGHFLHLSELTLADLGPDDTLVLVDDFAGTGDQADEALNRLKELLPDEPRIVVLVVVSTRRAASRLLKNSPQIVKAHRMLDSRHDLFHESCKTLTAAEREELLSLCISANKRSPRGYGDCGLSIVFIHKTPNNSIPLLHATGRNWKGLFPRIAEE